MKEADEESQAFWETKGSEKKEKRKALLKRGMQAVHKGLRITDNIIVTIWQQPIAMFFVAVISLSFAIYFENFLRGIFVILFISGCGRLYSVCYSKIKEKKEWVYSPVRIGIVLSCIALIIGSSLVSSLNEYLNVLHNEWEQRRVTEQDNKNREEAIRLYKEARHNIKMNHIKEAIGLLQNAYEIYPNHKESLTLLNECINYNSKEYLANFVNGINDDVYNEIIKGTIKEQFLSHETLNSSFLNHLQKNKESIKRMWMHRIARENEAESKRLANEKNANAKNIMQLALGSLIGKRPTHSKWDGSVGFVRDYMKQHTHDEDSIKNEKWYDTTFIEISDRKFWGTRVSFNAKNAFGAYVKEDIYFLSRLGKVVLTFEFSELLASAKKGEARIVDYDAYFDKEVKRIEAEIE